MQKKIRLLITGIGNDNPSTISKLAAAESVIARGSMAGNWLDGKHIPHSLFALDDAQTLNQWVDAALSTLKDGQTLAYVTPFAPVLSDQVAASLIHAVAAGNVEVISGEDLTQDLLINLPSLVPAGQVCLDGLLFTNKYFPPFSPDKNTLIFCPRDGGQPSFLQGLLSLVFPPEHKISILSINENDGHQWQDVELKQISEQSGDVSAIYIPALSADSSLESFQEVIAHLRAPSGCPWDRKQTHASLRTYLLEETYEALDALDQNDIQGLKEELGDLLLQILLHAQIAVEHGEFNMADVLAGINRKIVYRHPHVFKDWVVDGEKEVVQNWESLKTRERKNNGDENVKGMLDGVPASFPALAQAQAIQDRAARVGFDWPDIKPVMDKVLEELDEVNNAANDTERGKELGDLLFALVNLIRWYKVDAESALRETNLKFRKRFAYIEEQARQKGREMSQMTLEEMDVFWEQAKEFDD